MFLWRALSGKSMVAALNAVKKPQPAKQQAGVPSPTVAKTAPAK